MPAVLDRGHYVCLGGVVAGQLVRNHHTRHAGLLLQQLAEQALGGPLVAPALDENVEHEAILVDGPPEPMLLSPDHQAHFVEVPLVSRVWQLAADLVGEALAELARPLAHGDVRAFASGEAGHVRIGTGPTMAEDLLPQVCSALIAAAPDITVQIFIGM